ncbi:hypothetical protein RJ640_020618 [Escallonia rubra]|uniref:Uncharacterized protein n=1 Tax=Escallonia rubra TaxID=112253 RepID=A0AA88QVA1_9ASTE|nr:hypothetical protein RJ640_020618 [Escallonia rubra]
MSPKSSKTSRFCSSSTSVTTGSPGKFPYVVLQLPQLKFLDLRFNEFEGGVPRELFDKDLDAIFINHNSFVFDPHDNFGNSPVSVIVLADNKFHGCVPQTHKNGNQENNKHHQKDGEGWGGGAEKEMRLGALGGSREVSI